ncbi:MAG TPA: hypothetical protein VG425_03315 [Casimicrobiaceae bacterium]|jgi:hypothetical protein|nr:hypothetical protein [Casimicrobiaceae bacterium]
MFGKPTSVSRQWAMAAALALGASSVALADDSSMNPFIGDSYRYFNGRNVGDPGQPDRPALATAPADPSWRQAHPQGLPERDLQALSSSGLSAAAEQLDRPLVASALADASSRQHLNLGEREMQALSSSTLARWQVANGSESTAAATGDEARVAQSPDREAFPARLARFSRPESDVPAGTH